MTKQRNPFVIIITYPLTWLVFVLIGAAHAFFNYWFQPPLFFNLAAFLADVIGLGFWFMLVLKSSAFRKQINEMPYERQSREIGHILTGCPENFRTPAKQCMVLIDNINKEFKDQDYRSELSLLVANIYHLAGEHKKLFTRYQTFGTPEQKQQMKTLISQQVDSIHKIHDTLQTFSGNLTILAANAEKTAEATNELKYINEGLKEVIQTNL